MPDISTSVDLAEWPDWTPPLLWDPRDFPTENKKRVSAKWYGAKVVRQSLLHQNLLRAGLASESVINKTGSDIDEFKLVYISGYDATSGKFKITLADKDTIAAQYVTREAIANNAEGVVYRSADGEDLNTNSFSAVGDEVYLGDDGGFAISGAQVVGRVTVKNAVTGEIAFRVRDSLGTSELVVSTSNGATLKTKSISEEITLGAGATTDSVADLLPTNAFIRSITGRVTTGFAGTFKVGDSGIDDRVGTGISGALNTTFDMLASATPLPSYAQGSTAQKVRLTPSGGGAAAGGKVRVTVFYDIVTPPTS